MSDAQPDSQAAAPGARCGLHPERPALTVCRRCGNYMCESCTASGHFVHCPGCRGRIGIASFPFTREHWTFDGLLGHCFATWRAHAITLGLATLIFLGAVMGVSFVAGFGQAFLTLDADVSLAVSLVLQVVQTVLQLGLQLGFFAMCFDAVEGRTPELSHLLFGFRKLGAAILQLLIIYFVLGALGGLVLAAAWIAAGDLLSETALWIYGGAFLLLLVPVIYAGLGVAFAMLELARNPRSTALGAMAISWRTADGKRWAVLGVAIVSGLLSTIGMIACCVGVLVTYPLGVMLMCSLYLALGNTAEPPADAPPAPAVEAAPPLVDNPPSSEPDPLA